MRHSSLPARRLAAPILAIAVVLTAGACSDSNSAAPPPLVAAPPIQTPRNEAIANSSRPVVRWLEVTDATRYLVRIWQDGGAGAPIREYDADASTREWTIDPPLPDGRYSVGYEARDAAGRLLARPAANRFAVRVPPDWVPGIEITGAAPQLAVGGYTLLNLIDIFNPPGTEKVPALLLVNSAGEIAWWMRFDRYPGFLMSPKVLANGNLLFIAQQSPPPAGRTTIPGFGIEMDWSGQVVWQSPAGATPHHEIQQLADGRILMLTWVFDDFLEPFTGSIVRLEGDAIEIHDQATGRVDWRWNIFDHIDPLDWMVPEIGTPGLSFGGQDWSHANAVEWDAGRGVFWLSLRHLDCLLGIDYPSGEIRYRIGRQRFAEAPQLMSHQHAPEVQPDGTILLFDNGNSYPTPESRVTLIDFDETSGQAQIVWEWRDDPAFYDFALGDADRLPNGNILVTAGISRRVIEVVPESGTIAWDLRLIQDPAEARFAIYRSEHVEAEQIPAGVLPF